MKQCINRHNSVRISSTKTYNVQIFNEKLASEALVNAYNWETVDEAWNNFKEILNKELDIVDLFTPRYWWNPGCVYVAGRFSTSPVIWIWYFQFNYRCNLQPSWARYVRIICQFKVVSVRGVLTYRDNKIRCLLDVKHIFCHRGRLEDRKYIQHESPSLPPCTHSSHYISQIWYNWIMHAQNAHRSIDA